jgi:hypothetical protein
MSAKVVFLSQAPSADDARPVTAVNPKTVVERDGRALVLRLTGSTVEAVPVTRGRTLGDALEVTGSALKPGDRLVLAPPETLAGGRQGRCPWQCRCQVTRGRRAADPHPRPDQGLPARRAGHRGAAGHRPGRVQAATSSR